MLLVSCQHFILKIAILLINIAVFSWLISNSRYAVALHWPWTFYSPSLLLPEGIFGEAHVTQTDHIHCSKFLLLYWPYRFFCISSALGGLLNTWRPYLGAIFIYRISFGTLFGPSFSDIFERMSFFWSFISDLIMPGRRVESVLEATE